MSCCIAKISPSLRKPQSDSSGSSDSDSDSDLIGPPLPPQYSDEHMKQGDTSSDDDEEEEASDAEDDVSLIMSWMSDPWWRSCRLKAQTETWILEQIWVYRNHPSEIS